MYKVQRIEAEYTLASSIKRRQSNYYEWKSVFKIIGEQHDNKNSQKNEYSIYYKDYTNEMFFLSTLIHFLFIII